MNKIAMLVLSLSLSSQVYSSAKTDLDDFFSKLEKAQIKEELKNKKGKTMDLKISKPVLTRSNPKKQATLRNQPHEKDWFSRSPLEKMKRVGVVQLKKIDLPPIDTQKRCSDFDTLFNDCKEEPGSIYEAHQRTALAYAQHSRSHQ